MADLNNAVLTWYCPIEEADTLNDFWLHQMDTVRLEKIESARHWNTKIAHYMAGMLLFYGFAILKENPFGQKITYGEHGKPGTDGLCFSLSHTRNLCACTVASIPVGVDVEQIQYEQDKFKVAKRFFHPNEVRELENIEAGSLRQDAFYKYWTRKESYVKCEGTGLLYGMEGFDTTASQLEHYQLRSWRLKPETEKLNQQPCWISVCACREKQQVEIPEKENINKPVYISMKEIQKELAKYI